MSGIDPRLIAWLGSRQQQAQDSADLYRRIEQAIRSGGTAAQNVREDLNATIASNNASFSAVDDSLQQQADELAFYVEVLGLLQPIVGYTTLGVSQYGGYIASYSFPVNIRVGFGFGVMQGVANGINFNGSYFSGNTAYFTFGANVSGTVSVWFLGFPTGT